MLGEKGRVSPKGRFTLLFSFQTKELFCFLLIFSWFSSFHIFVDIANNSFKFTFQERK
jgi:hypothetical protein